MKCPECKFQNPEGIKFCGECGTKLEKKCPKCGFINPLQFKFCGECGFGLRQALAASSETSSPASKEINYREPNSYTPKHLASKILTSKTSIEGERKFVTVLFADVADYTSMSEQLDPEEIHQIMDGCFKILMEEIHKYEGTINQFTGDGVMALFGAPVTHEDHGLRACRAAITIQKAFEEYSRNLQSRFNVQFRMRIGINSGLVVVGSIGDDLRMDYTAVGDTTNLAARMESLAEPGTILLSFNTYKLVKEFFEIKSKGEVKVKGKEKLQKIFQLIKPGGAQTRIHASIAKGLTRFVGRKNSMGSLTEAFEYIRSGSGHVVGIIGEAGVGKSRLLLEMVNRLPEDDFQYLEGRCLQYGGSMLYLPILDILRSIFNIQDDDKEFQIKRKISDVITGIDEKFISLAPSFQDILSLKVDDKEYVKLEPKEKREKTFEAIRNLLIKMSQNKPLVMAIEDLHWIDKTSQEFLNYLMDWLANTPILLILLYRPEYTHQWGSKSFYTKIGLDQLGLSSSGELIKAILEEGKVAPELRQLILNRSAGNPLFMEEFTNTLLENGSIEKQNDFYTINCNPEDIKIPDTIQGIIAARLDRLEENLKRTMQVASVIGRDFAFKLLQSITGMRTELKSYLLNLQGLEFIYEKNLFPELEYIFKHALTQEVAYNSLLQKRRKEIHEKIGMAIEELYPARLEEFYEMLAYHYCKSDNGKKAVHYSKFAGEKAAKNFAHWDAYYFFKDAFDFLGKKPDSSENKREKIEVLDSMIQPLVYVGMPDEALWAIEKKIEIGKQLEDNIVVARSYIAKATYYSYQGNNKLAVKSTKLAFDEAKASQNLDLIVVSSCALSLAYNTEGEYLKIVELAPEIIEMIEKSNRKSSSFSYPIDPYSLLSLNCGLSMVVTGFFEQGTKYLKTGLDNAYETNHLMTIGYSELYYGIMLEAKGDWELSIQHLKSGIKQCQKANFIISEALCLCCMGYANSMLGDFTIGKKNVNKGIQLYKKSGIEMTLSLAYLYSIAPYFESDDLQNARTFAKECLRLSQKNNEKNIEGRALVWMGRIVGKTELDHHNKAEKYIFEGIKILQKLKVKPYLAQSYLSFGELYSDFNENDKAIENLKTAEAMFQEMGMDFWLNRTQNLLAEL
ncbi:MAG: AAA family ATPase [Deltaproteobacteria bacterium]|nr:AAA family ATPase [Deltaproteobacteria bacterium]